MLLNTIRRCRRLAARESSSSSQIARRRPAACLEQIEPRLMLSVAPAFVGAVYIEEDFGSDGQGDVIEVSFVGGAPDSQLQRIVIHGDQNGGGFDDGDIFFDTTDSGWGADVSFPFSIVSQEGIDRVTATVVDGSSELTLDFDGFDPGEVLRFSIDVDEVEFLDPSETDLRWINDGFDPITSGVEFQGSSLSATLTAPHFETVETLATFMNRYDDQFARASLDLSPDDVDGKRDRTAGAVAHLQQQPIPASISGHVFHDRNGNGRRDGDETAIAGVAIRAVPLDTFDDQDVVMTVTDREGFYEFENLIPGSYQLVEIEQPVGYYDGIDKVGTVNGQSVGTAANPGDMIDDIFLPGGAVGVDYDFGEILPASISGHVFHDRNGNGRPDEGEEPIAGVSIQAVPGNTFDEQDPVVAVTNLDGFYEFQNLMPGPYQLFEVEQPNGYLDGIDRVGTIDGVSIGTAVNPGDRMDEIFLSSGSVGRDYDFGEILPVSIRGQVHFPNAAGDCFDESIEHRPVINAVVRLEDQQGNLIAETVTDQQGHYEFQDLTPGIYSIIEETPDGLIDGSAQVGTVGGLPRGFVDGRGRISQIELASGETGVSFDFCEQEVVSISGNVHLSGVDADCFAESMAVNPLADVFIKLWNEAGQIVASTRTDAEGNYQFVDLLPGVYSLVERTPDGLFDGAARVGFVEGQPTGQVLDPSQIAGIQLKSGQQAVHYDFCEFPPSQLGGVVYHDRSNDGQQTAGEEGIANVRVTLLDDGGQSIAETHTDETGRYEFSGLPAGIYTIREQQPAGWLDGLDRSGRVAGRSEGIAENPGDQIREVRLNWGELGQDYNFGELQLGRIEGVVHLDLNADCHQQEGERGLAGVRVELLDQAGLVVQAMLTHDDGQFFFDELMPGTYTLREIQPDGYFQGGQRAGSGGGQIGEADLISQIVVGSADVWTDYAFCEEPPSAISGFVFRDGPVIQLQVGESLPGDITTIRDGQLTSDDQRLQDVVLELRDGITGAPLLSSVVALPGVYPAGPITTTTDANGFYLFKGLHKGNYAVYQIQPDGLIDGLDSGGTIPSVAINRQDEIAPAILDALESDPNFDAIVRIALPPGQYSRQNNFSEIDIERKLIVPFDGPNPVTPLPAYRLRIPVIEPIRVPDLELLSYELPVYGFTQNAWANTWHLSVIDGGSPRGDGERVPPQGPIWLDHGQYEIAWSNPAAHQMKWTLLIQNGETLERLFGIEHGIPVTGDFNGDGFTEVGVFAEGQWFIDLNGDGNWDENDLWAQLGHQGDLPVTGDWDGDGKADIGIYGLAWSGDPRAIGRERGLPDRESDAHGEAKNLPGDDNEEQVQGARTLKHTVRGETRSDQIDHVFHYGAIGNHPVAGDWNGDGVATIGVFERGEWRLDRDGDGNFAEDDIKAQFGAVGDIPVVGDFNGDGVDEIAVYRGTQFIMDTNRNHRIDEGDQVVAAPRGRPVVGDWNGDGTDDVGVVEQQVRFAEIDPR